MMVNLFSYPFRVNPDGTVAKSPEDENYYAQELANLIMTQPGERHLVPDYGITDPVFDNLNAIELLGKVEMFGPPVAIQDNDIIISWPKEGVLSLNITYNPADTDSDDDMINSGLNDDDNYFDDTADETDNSIDIYGFNERTDF